MVQSSELARSSQGHLRTRMLEMETTAPALQSQAVPGTVESARIGRAPGSSQRVTQRRIRLPRRPLALRILASFWRVPWLTLQLRRRTRKVCQLLRRNRVSLAERPQRPIGESTQKVGARRTARRSHYRLTDRPRMASDQENYWWSGPASIR